MQQDEIGEGAAAERDPLGLVLSRTLASADAISPPNGLLMLDRLKEKGSLMKRKGAD